VNSITDRMRNLSTLIGWCTLLFIAFATLAPIGDRPHIAEMSADMERFAAFFLLAGTLAFAYPKRLWIVLVAVVALVIGLEVGQTFEATRHGQQHDAVVKIFGALAGMTIAIIVDKLASRLRPAS
jgi:VanZ family protein